MQAILTVFHLFLAIGLVGLILIQHGKGADMGAAFGSGASGTVFGAKGSGSFLTRATAALAILFFVTSMVMAYFSTQGIEPLGVMETFERSPAVQVEEMPQSDIPPIPMNSDMPDVVPAAESTGAIPEVASEQPVPSVDSTSNTEGAAPAE
ncbi:MAG: preprotein translocase subunit SecG [Candidatus Thiodiazotropha sp. (ex Lucinoma aequizonata)]|nr:preprotein translocase subunit SecG [Candidatus Thiodiazotropha sp. (ex Lucinoma aequizonata)]MCU7887571.1 preprotein translocase subunit SecG [Candidatus Thiodiazotropha sp. (ex Lucinoma aequizonata)]MCU7895244.1 preprotein translocase subunit SecG [Candidatus Thiodiazotropha sp. (ex Lucinoma aequizonata)]MCU7900475.1 preprotein translocase subunit SecG [Candidatus Thiodiazotropha sp. (ex Lucinoma aequizonata)]MCU7902712.1 preprotein translocase subunit SecG [Candidatus Thiodiazotropha sp. 